MKNTFEGLISTLDPIKERFSKLKGRSREITQTGAQIEKRIKK